MRLGSRILQQGRRPLAVAALLILIGAPVFMTATWRYHVVLVHEAQERTNRLSFLLSEQAARTFEAVDFTLRGFEPLLDSEASLRPGMLDALLERRVRELNFVQTIRVLDPEGRTVSSSDSGARGTTDPGCLAALAAPGAAPLAIGCAAGDVGSKGWPAIAVARRLSDPAGRFRGAIVADIDPGYFSRFFSDLDLGPHAVVTLSENRGHMLLASTRPPDQEDTDAPPTLVPPTERARLGEAARSSRDQITADHTTDGYPLSVLVSINRGDVNRRWLRVILPVFALTLVAGSLMVLLALVFERQRTERIRAQRRAAIAQTLETMGQMTASAAHDFRNLLTALQGSLRLLGKRGADAALLEQASATLVRGNAMVDRLLAFSRREEVRLEAHDVNAVIGGIRDTLRHVAGPAATLGFELASDLPQCRLDRIQFEAALMNLVVNARQAMPEGGAITVASRALDGGAVELSVCDTGCGIDAATLAHVFEPFFTTKTQTGTGLGLAQVQGFVGEIGGRASIDSTVGAGTAVLLRLPGLPPHPVPIAPPHLVVADSA